MTSYPTPEFTRPALAPGLLGAVALVVGILLIDGAGFLFILFAASILACIIAVFAWQAKSWWWLLGLAPIVVLWNPIWPLPLTGQGWLAAQFIAAAVFIAAGILIKVPNPEDRNRRDRGR